MAVGAAPHTLIKMSEKRKKRSQKILNTVRENPWIEKEKLIALCSLEWGTARRTILEYINTLIAAEVIKADNGKLST